VRLHFEPHYHHESTNLSFSTKAVPWQPDVRLFESYRLVIVDSERLIRRELDSNWKMAQELPWFVLGTGKAKEKVSSLLVVVLVDF